MTLSERSRPRKAARDVRRRQLMEATIDVLAARGYASLTIGDVSRAAGLSVGIVNFHFDSKAALLADTLKYLAVQYRANWTAAVERAGDDPAARLYAMTSADFGEDVCTPRTLQAWVSFWAEAQSQPAYDEVYGEEEAEYLRTLETMCAELSRQGGYDRAQSGKLDARVINALTDGLWVALAHTPPGITRSQALSALHNCLAAFYPAHFDANGPVN
ncbi:MAG: TetR family transcriptional regulator C-terminal domain-containing protein [Anderseniella sp.]